MGHGCKSYVYENNIYISNTTKHMFITSDKILFELTKVQEDEYIKEDDIVRFENKFKCSTMG